MERGMHVGIEATSLLDPRSAVGHGTSAIVDALITLDEGVRVVLFPLKVRHGGRVRANLADSPRIEVARGRLPQRLAEKIWSRVEWPPAELFCGALDVFWGTNYVLPPLVKAAGVVSVHDLSFVQVPETCTADALQLTQIVPRMVQRANRVVVPSDFIAQELAAW